MKPVVIKLHDPECQQCIEMHSVEKAALEEYGTEFMSMDLEFAAMHPTIFDYVSAHVVDEEGEMEMPCYLFVDENDTITGHFCGKGTHHDISGEPVELD